VGEKSVVGYALAISINKEISALLNKQPSYIVILMQVLLLLVMELPRLKALRKLLTCASNLAHPPGIVRQKLYPHQNFLGASEWAKSFSGYKSPSNAG